jgi:hypothetical protein
LNIAKKVLDISGAVNLDLVLFTLYIMIYYGQKESCLSLLKVVVDGTRHKISNFDILQLLLTLTSSCSPYKCRVISRGFSNL